ncbi:zinc finger protein 346 [Drosophila tropicalis]|uniref:zinc finger protein 346 n=1 Tax=Drosophila tropicalis TaxID=46794 RepID=UPI0035AB809A
MSSSEYLSGYHIPLLIGGSAPPPALSQGDQSNRSVSLPHRSKEEPLDAAKRFTAPGKHGMYIDVEVDAPPRAKKQKPSNGIDLIPITTTINNGDGGPASLVMFPGRDESYPDELNKLIKPLSCKLCQTQMTSMKSARDHYESKSHDRHISAWLAKNYTEIGLQLPPIKRLIKQGPIGPNAFHCDLCDLALTSTPHMRQHYAGRKHKLVEQRRSKPSGAGYYTNEGKWVRTGSKVGETPPDGRFGIGVMFIAEEQQQQQQPQQTVPQPAAAATASEDQPLMVVDPSHIPVSPAASGASLYDSLTCDICKINVTSPSQMQMHCEGSKHQKNLRIANGNPLAMEQQPPLPALPELSLLSAASTENFDVADLSMYRTPSGSYYCKLCNKYMNHVTILQQHLIGKKHIKMVRQQATAAQTESSEIAE